MTLFCCSRIRRHCSRDNPSSLPQKDHTNAVEEAAIQLLAKYPLPTPPLDTTHLILPEIFPFIIQLKEYDANLRGTVKQSVPGAGGWFSLVTPDVGEAEIRSGSEREFVRIDDQKLKKVLRRKKGDGIWLKRCGNATEYRCLVEGHELKQWSFYVLRWEYDSLQGEIPGMVDVTGDKGKDSEGEVEGHLVAVDERKFLTDIKAFFHGVTEFAVDRVDQEMTDAASPSLPPLRPLLAPVTSGKPKTTKAVTRADTAMLTPPPSTSLSPSNHRRLNSRLDKF